MPSDSAPSLLFTYSPTASSHDIDVTRVFDLLANVLELFFFPFPPSSCITGTTPFRGDEYSTVNISD
jgi:hypothetical protein